MLLFRMFLLFLIVATSSAYPGGAPPGVCSTMLPKHKVDPQTTPSQYEISVSKENEEMYNVIIESPTLESFKGFMLQARNPDDNEIIGTFESSIDTAKSMDCTNPSDTSTHTQNNMKQSVSVLWRPYGYKGTVIFTATVVQEYKTFWTNIKSSEIQVASEITTTTEATNTGTTEAPNPGTSEAPETDFYEGCDETKACFGAPANCIQSQNCEAAVAVTVIEDIYVFELTAAPSAAWVGVGLSRDTKMGDDSVIECAKNGNTVEAYISTTSTDYDVTRDEDQGNIQLLRHKSIDGWLNCRVQRKTVTTINGITYDLINDKFHLLIASGSWVKKDKVGIHDKHNLANSEKKLLSDVSPNKAASKILVKLHGIFMLIAWVGTASIGIILARYYKSAWPGKQICGKDIWFASHRFLMILTWAITITGFILIWVELKAWSQADSPHAILGMITTILCFIQPIGAMFRPHPGTKYRPIFNWLHWFVGNSAHIVGIVTIFFAVSLSKAELPEWLYWILGVFVLLYALMHSFSSVLSRLFTKVTKQNSVSNEETLKAPFSAAQRSLLYLYIILNIVIVVALTIITGMGPFE